MIPLFAQEHPQQPIPPQPPIREKERFLPPEIEAEAMAYIKEMSAARAEMLNKMKFVHPNEYREQLFRIYEEKSKLEELRMFDLARYEQIVAQQKLEQKSWELAENYRSADPKKKEIIKKELLAVLNNLFDLKETDKKHEIARLEEELKKLHEMINYRNQNKDKIIEKHLKEMLGEMQSFDW